MSGSLRVIYSVVFSGDNYDEANQEMLTARGVWRIDSGVEAICRYTDPKNTALFESMGVLKPNECAARTHPSHAQHLLTLLITLQLID